MNHYKKYKLEKVVSKLLTGFFTFILYIPAQMYKKDGKFKKWIDKRSRLSSEKKNLKKLMSGIFRDIEESEINTCVVYPQNDYDLVIPCDRYGWSYKMLFDHWYVFEKNNLKVEKLRFEDYINKYRPDEAEKLKWYYWNNKKDDVILVISK